MEKIISLFKKGRLFSFLAVIALVALIWFLGPSLSIYRIRPLDSETVRLILIASIIVIWLIWLIWSSYQARKRNQALLNDISDNAGSELSNDQLSMQEEASQLDHRLKAALTQLKQSRLGDNGKKGKHEYLYQLPWYMIIGYPGSGKTTLLANSNLHFPLTQDNHDKHLSGEGGTRYCDWWFTDEAVLLDTAGRYTEQDSNQAVDQAAWQNFLGLLKKHRTQQPINGIIIAISVAELLQQSPEERQRHAQKIRQRIQELHQQLNIRFPIYLMFTKADLLAGFNTFFDDLNNEMRGQVWGMTFSFNEDDQAQGFNNTLFQAEFTLLEERIHQQLIDKLENERHLPNRQTLYTFPQQFSALKDVVGTFLHEMFRQSNLQHNVLLRGVYFTSATQTGSPIDRIMSSLAQQFGIAQQNLSQLSGKGKSFFINRLLSDVIFAESGLAGTNIKLKQKMQWLQRFAVISILIATLIMTAIWYNSYRHNQQIIANYQQSIIEVKRLVEQQSPNDTLSDQLPLLNKVRQLTASYSDHQQAIPLAVRWGLYQGKPLGESMDTKYIQLLRNTVQPHAKTMLEKLLRDSQDDTGQLFSLLKVYLYLGGKAPENTALPAIEADWNNNNKTDAEDSQLDKHFLTLLQNSSKGSFRLDQELIEQSRTRLENADLTEIAYQNLKSRYLYPKDQGVEDFNVLQHEPLQEINQSFMRKSGKEWSDGIPGLFTKQGFYNVFLENYASAVDDLKGDSWVLGDAAQYKTSGAIDKKVIENYQRDYIQYWDTFINDLSIRSLGSKVQSISILEPLTPKSENLILELLLAIKKETDFSEEKNEKFIGISFELKEILSNVDKHFKPLNEWAMPEKLDKLTQLIDEIYIGFNNETTFGQIDNNQVQLATGKLKAEVLRLPEALKNMLLNMINETQQQLDQAILNNRIQQLKTDLNEQVAISCREHIAGHYPFSHKKQPSVNMGHFTEIFGSNGKMPRFDQDHLKKNDTLPITLLNQLQPSFQQAERIQKAFFSQGHLHVSFALELVSITQPAYSIEVNMGAIKHTFYKVGDKYQYEWPSTGIETVFTVADPNTPPPTAIIEEAKEKKAEEVEEATEDLRDDVRENLRNDPILAGLGEELLNELAKTAPPKPAAQPEKTVEETSGKVVNEEQPPEENFVLAEPIHEKITAGQTPWELFELVNNHQIKMSGAVFKVHTNITPSPFTVAQQTMKTFSCPSL
ncbi:MAG: type VI secretion system membrane subunit TssM [bacterium]